MIVLVAGSREFTDRLLVRRILDRELLPPLTGDPSTWFPPADTKVVFPGGADRGSSVFIRDWCDANFCPREGFPILPTDGSYHSNFRARNKRLLAALPQRAILFGEGRTVDDLRSRLPVGVPLLAVVPSGMGAIETHRAF